MEYASQSQQFFSLPTVNLQRLHNRAMSERNQRTVKMPSTSKVVIIDENHMIKNGAIRKMFSA